MNTSTDGQKILMRRASQLTILAGAVVCFVVILVWWRHDRFLPNEPFLRYVSEQWQTWRSGDLLERESRSLSGSRAIDCGRTQVGKDTQKVSDCAQAAFANNRPFRARWQLQGIDGEVEDALVTTPDGRAYQLQLLVGPFVPGARRVQKYECPKPVTLMKENQSGKLTCFQP